jgi:conjugal transfer ATP-binding protein TraC
MFKGQIMTNMNFVEIAVYIAKYFGLDPVSQNIAINTCEKIQELVMENLGDAKSLSEYFAYRYFDEESSLFLSGDGWSGFLIELTPIVGSDENIVKNLEHFFNNGMLDNSWIQFLLIASNDIENSLKYWKSARVSNSPSIKKLAENRENFLSNLASDFKNSNGVIPRNFKLYLNYSYKTGGSSREFQKLKIFMQNLKQKLESINLNPSICDVEDLIKIVIEIIELDTSFPKRKTKNYDPNRIISDQILTPGFNHDILEDRIEHRNSNLCSKCYFILDAPKEFSLNEMIKLLGDGIRDHLSIPARFIISYTVANNLNKATQNAVIKKGEGVIDSSEQWYSRNNRDIKREATEWKEIADRAKNGERFLSEYFQIMITAPSDFIDEAQESLFSLYNILDWHLEVNRYFQLPALLSILPLHSFVLWKYLSHFKLTRTVLSKEVIAKLPIHAEWKGVPEPGMLLIGRRGQLFHWNPFYRISSGNYNICIFGPSGSGKSVFLQELATNMIAQNAKIFILDIGQSFKNICKLLEGEIIEFGSSSNIVLNPFCGFDSNLEEEDRNIAITYAKSIICSMCGAKGDSLKESIIEKSIIKGLELHGAMFNITKLSELLRNEENSEIAMNLSLSLFSYSKEGIYGKFFGNEKNNRFSEAKFDKAITVFEFEEIKNDPLLLAVVLQIIGMQIFMQVLTGNRDKRFVLIVDEAWMILDYAAKFLAEFARTIRKYGGSLVVCVQNFADLQNGDHHKSILQNSTWTLLLKQDEKGINAFKDSEAFKDIIPLIKSISISRDKYAEVLICSTGVKVIGRLVLDDYSKILYSTDAEIFNMLNQLLEDGIKIDKAVEIISKRKYENL